MWLLMFKLSNMTCFTFKFFKKSSQISILAKCSQVRQQMKWRPTSMQSSISLRKWSQKLIFKFWMETWLWQGIWLKSKWCLNWFRNWSWWLLKKERINLQIKTRWIKPIRSSSNNWCFNNRQHRKLSENSFKNNRCEPSTSLNSQPSPNPKTETSMILTFKKNPQNPKSRRKSVASGQDSTSTSTKEPPKRTKKSKNSKRKRTRKRKSRNKNWNKYHQSKPKRMNTSKARTLTKALQSSTSINWSNFIKTTPIPSQSTNFH